MYHKEKSTKMSVVVAGVAHMTKWSKMETLHDLALYGQMAAISSNADVRTQEWVVEPNHECENQVFANR